jgi:hypothetical protein
MKDLRLAKGLGWFSIGLGLTQILAPGWLGRAIGVGERKGLMRALGAREIITGLGVLAQQPRPALPVWGRVAGDAMDMALLAAAFKNPYNDRGRVAGAAGMVLGVGLLDWACARSLESYH